MWTRYQQILLSTVDGNLLKHKMTAFHSNEEVESFTPKWANKWTIVSYLLRNRMWTRYQMIFAIYSRWKHAKTQHDSTFILLPAIKASHQGELINKQLFLIFSATNCGQDIRRFLLSTVDGNANTHMTAQSFQCQYY